ncbi:hypothetical protein HK101_011577, partial [Irineochytrium annulatum]
APWHSAPVTTNVDFATCSINCAKDQSNVAVGITYPVWFDGQNAGLTEDTYCYCLTSAMVAGLGVSQQCEPCGQKSTEKGSKCGVSLLQTTGQSGSHSYAIAAYFLAGAPNPPTYTGPAVPPPRTTPSKKNSLCLQYTAGATVTSPPWVPSNLGTTFEACYLTCQADARSLGVGLAQPKDNASEVDCYCLHGSDVAQLGPSKVCAACPSTGEFGGYGCGEVVVLSTGMGHATEFGVEAYFFDPVSTVAKTFPNIL